MCPLRFILVFLSAVLAGYLAWRSASSSAEPSVIVSPDDSALEKEENSKIEKRKIRLLLKMMQKGFWVFIDMASGRYLWRKVEQLNSCSQHAD